jgi:hypothetical protein
MRSFKLLLKLWPTSAGYLSEGGVKTQTIPTHVGGRSGTQTATGRFWKCLLGVPRLAKSPSCRDIRHSEHGGVGGWIRPPTLQLF